jgi:hypothetical protein
METELYGVTVECEKWQYRGFIIEERPDLSLVIKSPSGVLEGVKQEFTYNLYVYRLGALNSIRKMIDQDLDEK